MTFWNRDKFASLPLIRLRPGPSDAELAAERERKYQQQLRDDSPCSSYPFCECGNCDWPTGEVIG